MTSRYAPWTGASEQQPWPGYPSALLFTRSCRCSTLSKQRASGFAESRTAATDAALSALAVVHAEALAERILTTLSGGEFQRVMMATLIAQDAQTFLLDEPANPPRPRQTG